MSNLDSFVNAQEYSYESARVELINERKKTHWMWYVFPQIKGLSFSYESYYYGIDGN